MSTSSDESTIRQVHQWITQCVLGLSLCPYAQQPYRSGAVAIALIEGVEQMLPGIDEQAQLLLDGTDETVLLVLQSGLSDFLDFNDFIDDVEHRLVAADLDDQLQVVTFHPDYQFAGEAVDDPSNYTNRAPFPIVQLLRVESVSKVVDAGDTLAIPEKNMQTLRALEAASLHRLFPWVAR